MVRLGYFAFDWTGRFFVDLYPVVMAGSFYHHTASRVSTDFLSYWRNLAFGGEYTYRLSAAGRQ